MRKRDYWNVLGKVKVITTVETNQDEVFMQLPRGKPKSKAITN